MQKILERINSGIYSESFVVIDDFITEDQREALLTEQNELLEKGKFRQAAVGVGPAKQVRTEIRSDEVLWMDQEHLSPVQQVYWDKVEQIRNALNQRCYLGLRSFEAHFARYPVGSFYKRHLDQFHQVIYRQVTVILYLNDSWSTEDGGALRIYLSQPDGSEKVQDILPLGRRLVVFLSGEIPHEVLPTHKERVSITGWLKNTD